MGVSVPNLHSFGSRSEHTPHVVERWHEGMTAQVVVAVGVEPVVLTH